MLSSHGEMEIEALRQLLDEFKQDELRETWWQTIQHEQKHVRLLGAVDLIC